MRTLVVMAFVVGHALAQIPEGSVKILGQRLSVREVVKDTPYQATVTTEVRQPLADGNEILRKTVARMARDSRGRVRLEQVEPETNRMILVDDPGAGTGFSYSPGTGRAQTYGHKKSVSVRMPAREGTSMGKAVVDGIAVEGTRNVVVIPAGQVGNVRPLEVVDETWYSPELRVILMSLHSDPRSGVVTYRLSALERREPDPKLFELPDGAQVQH